MKQIRTIIIDDEPLARKRIIDLLQNESQIKIVGEARNGNEAILEIKKKTPDLIFLDIQMPDMNGFQVIQKIEPNDVNIVIFVTAFDQYALKAFEIHAMGYLLKPFDDERFFKIIELAKSHIKMKLNSELNNKLLNLINEYQSPNENFISTFHLKEKGRNIFVDVDEILWIESYGNYLKFHLENMSYLYRKTMNFIESELNPLQFIRIHRSYLLNKVYIKSVRYLNNNEYEFKLKNGTIIISGRSFKEKIQEYLN